MHSDDCIKIAQKCCKKTQFSDAFSCAISVSLIRNLRRYKFLEKNI